MKEQWLNRPVELTDNETDELIYILTKRCGLKTVNRIASILTYDFETIRETGILDRFYIGDTGINYCAGQSYPCEIRRIRQEIMKRWP